MAQTFPLPDATGERVRVFRTGLRDWSRARLAEETESIGHAVDRFTINRIEKGQRAELGELLAIAAALGVSVLDLNVTAEDYPEMPLFEASGWDPAKVPALPEREQNRWHIERPIDQPKGTVIHLIDAARNLRRKAE